LWASASVLRQSSKASTCSTGRTLKSRTTRCAPTRRDLRPGERRRQPATDTARPSSELLIDHARLDSPAHAPDHFEGFAGDAGVNVEDDVADLVARLEVLAEYVDAARGELRVYLAEDAGDVAVYGEYPVRAGLRREAGG